VGIDGTCFRRLDPEYYALSMAIIFDPVSANNFDPPLSNLSASLGPVDRIKSGYDPASGLDNLFPAW
jgi:hypothetical protein